MENGEATRRIAVFIDTPNMLIPARKLGYKDDYLFRKFFDLIKQYGKISEGYAYGDFERLNIYFAVQYFLISQSIKLVHCPGNFNGKCKLDDPMLVEGIHGALRRDADYLYILVSSDIMLMPVGMTLRNLNKNFKIFGFAQNASDSLKEFPEFIDLGCFLVTEGNHSSGEQK